MNSKSLTLGTGLHGVIVRAEMFGQLTGGLEAAWNKLKGEGSHHFAFSLINHLSLLFLLAVELGHSKNISWSIMVLCFVERK